MALRISLIAALVAALVVPLAALSCRGGRSRTAREVPAAESDTVAVRVSVDSSRRDIIVLAGPFRLLAATAGHHAHSAHTGSSHTAQSLRFDWPVAGWFRGYELTILDARGAPLPRSLVHHLVVANLDRRQLLYPTAERLLAVSLETGAAEVPSLIGIPLRPGQHLAMYMAWRGDTGRDVGNVYLRLRLSWTAEGRWPRPVDVLPIYMDVNYVSGGSSAYDLPPGRSAAGFHFRPPVSGRLLGVSGHLHDFGLSVRLEDEETGRTLVVVHAKRDTAGRIVRMEQKKLLGILGLGIPLRAGHRYRLVGEYDNPLGDTLRLGAMTHMAGVFAPDSLGAWPPIDPGNAEYQRDLAAMREIAPAMRRAARPASLRRTR
ncbi:MAG: hypothetical protein WKG32_21335 [Gemmatimonadaceae bacterium]